MTSRIVVANDATVGNAAGDDVIQRLATSFVHVNEHEALGNDHRWAETLAWISRASSSLVQQFGFRCIL